MIDMRVVAAFDFPVLADHRLGAVGHHQHRDHAERMRRREVARQILEHRRLGRIDAVLLEKAFVGLGRRLRLQLGGDDVEHVLEMLMHVEAAHHRVGVLAGAVGEDQLAAGQLFQRGAERRIGLQRRMVDLVDELEVVVRVDAVLGHQPAHGGAVTLVIVLLDAEGLVRRHLQEVDDEGADAVVDELPQQVMRVEGVVEVEHPGVDMPEIARGQTG